MALDGRYRVLHDTQHAVETDLFLNPGEEGETAPGEGLPAR